MNVRLLTLGIASLAGPWIAPAPAAAQARELTGVYYLVWHVAESPATPVRMSELLRDETGTVWELDGTAAATAPYGGPLALNRREVRLTGFEEAGEHAAAPTRRLLLSALQPLGLLPSAAHPAATEQQGSKPYATLLCRFADHATTTPKPASYYQSLLTGGGYPSLDHYWREISDNRIDLAGSVVTSWYDLPSPKAAYFPNGQDKNPDWWKMVEDCTGVADAVIDFRQFSGVNMQFNTSMWASWGGSAYVSADGVNRVLPMTWMADWATQATYGHEIGHSLGLPHSSGPYNGTYDSRWDVMSGGQGSDGAETVGVHTIAYHKALLGWIPAPQRRILQASGTSSFRLQRLAMPGSASDFLLAEIPLEGALLYTIEVRRPTGDYDRWLPGDGVVMHLVDPNRGDRAAQVVDPDGNGNANDAGAIWTPGEIFDDVGRQISVAVLSDTTDGFDLLVTRGGFNLLMAVEGAGTVTSVPEGIDCPGASCHGGFSAGTTVTLTPAASPGQVFLGWQGGDCSGTGACTFPMSASRSTSARFQEQLVMDSGTARPSGVMGSAYADTLSARGGTGRFTWSVAAGALPRGVTLSSGGVLSGIPASAGEHAFTAQVVSGTQHATHAFQLRVDRPTLLPTTVMGQLLGTGGTLSADELRYLDMIGNGNGRLDVGDVRAWLIETGQIPAGSTSR